MLNLARRDTDSAPPAPLAAPSSDFAADMLRMLEHTPRAISPKYFYDDEGSRLFERICELPEYYIPRVETALLRDVGPEVARLAGPGVEVVELGCGTAHKTGLLLRALPVAAT